MPITYNSLNAFFNAYKEPKRFVSNEDIDSLIEELRSVAQVYRKPDDTVVVFPLKEYSSKNLPQKTYHQKHYTKLSASLEKELVRKFSQACKALGVSQTSVLIPVLVETIEKAHVRNGVHIP